MDKVKLLDRAGTAGETRLLLAKVLDKLEQAQSRGVPAYTDFLTPAEQAAAQSLLRAAGVGEEEYVLLGGYEAAERKLFFFLPDWLSPEEAEAKERAVREMFERWEAMPEDPDPEPAEMVPAHAPANTGAPRRP